MKRFSIYDSWSGKTLFSLAVSVVLLAFLWASYDIGFETNDDTGILGFVAGYKTGTPTAATIFCGVLWGGFEAFLYTLTGAVPWYTVTYMALLIISMTALLKSLMTICRRRGFPVYIPFIIFLILFFGVFFSYLVRMQFTVMSSFCGIGAISLLLTQERPDELGLDKKQKPLIRDFVWAFALLIFSFSIRPSVGYIVLAAAAVAMIVFWLKDIKKEKAYGIVRAAVTIALAAVLSYGSTAVYESTPEWRKFREYHYERAAYTDWLKPSYGQYPEVYESVGWTVNVAALAGSCFFMEENIDTDAFLTVNDAKRADMEEVSAVKQAERNLYIVYKSIINNNYYFCLFSVLCAFCMVGCICFIVRRKWFLAVIEILIVLAAIAALVFMITEYDRLLARTYAAAMFLPVTVSALLLPEALDISFFRKKWWICFLIVPVCFFMGMLEQQQKLEVGAPDISSMGVKRQAEEYAIAHHGNIYIYDNSMALPGDPFVTYPDTKPNNLIFWGGSGMYSPPYYEQLESLGLDELYPPQFFDENVCFIGAKEPSPVLEEYMYNRFPGSSCVITDETDSFIVYRFIR